MNGRFTTILLDIDGTLIDSNDAHARAWVDVCKEFGFPREFEDVRSMIGMGGDKVLPELTGLEEGTPEGDKILDRRGDIFRANYAPSLEPFEGTRALIQRFLADGYKLIVATSAGEDDLDILLEKAGVADLIERATTSDDAEESKPAPDIVEAALKKAKAKPEEAIMIGDTPYDVSAATKAGVTIVAVRCGGWQDEELKGALEVYEDPAEVLARYSESVFSKK